jgi:hypothetical protein
MAITNSSIIVNSSWRNLISRLFRSVKQIQIIYVMLGRQLKIWF